MTQSLKTVLLEVLDRSPGPTPRPDPNMLYTRALGSQMTNLNKLKEMARTVTNNWTTSVIVISHVTNGSLPSGRVVRVSGSALGSMFTNNNLRSTQLYSDLFFGTTVPDADVIPVELGEEVAGIPPHLLFSAGLPLPVLPDFDFKDGRFIRKGAKANVPLSAPNTVEQIRPGQEVLVQEEMRQRGLDATVPSSFYNSFRTLLRRDSFFSNASTLTLQQKLVKIAETMNGSGIPIADIIRNIRENDTIVHQPTKDKVVEILDNDSVIMSVNRRVSDFNVELMMGCYRIYLSTKFPGWPPSGIIKNLSYLIIIQGYNEASEPIKLQTLSGDELLTQTRNFTQFLDRDIGFNQKLIIRYFSEEYYDRFRNNGGSNNWLNLNYNDDPSLPVILGMEYWCDNIDLLVNYFRSKLYHAKTKMTSNQRATITTNQFRKISAILAARGVDIPVILQRIRAKPLNPLFATTGKAKAVDFSTVMMRIIDRALSDMPAKQ